MGKYCRNKPLVFSFVPRGHGLCGSQKYTFTFVATVKRLCEANSVPRQRRHQPLRERANGFGQRPHDIGGVFASQTKQEQEARVALDERGDVCVASPGQ